VNIRQFRDDDYGYLSRAAAHPAGFVLNLQRSLNSSDARLHCAHCRTINGVPARGKTWTGPYIKVCSASLADLHDWAGVHLRSAVPSCRTCQPPRLAAIGP
jgi:hypothetical protein